MGRLTIASIKMIYRDKQALFWAIVFPLLFATVFGFFDFEAAPDVRVVVAQPQIAVVQPAVDGLKDALKQIEFFKVSGIDSVEAGSQKVRDGDADLVLAVEPTGEGTNLKVTAFYNSGNPQQNQIAFSALSRVIDGMNLQMAGVTDPPVVLAREAVTDKNVSYYDFILPGLVAMGVMNYSISAMAVSIARYREQRILKRILATPLRPSRFVGGQVGAHLLLAVVQAVIILAVGILVFGGTVNGSIVALVALVTVANIIFLNIGFAVGGRAKTAEAASGVANVVALPMMFLSGVFFPIETLPDAMEKLVSLLPLTPLIEAMRKIAIDGDSIADCGPQVLALLIWMVVSFGLARANFSFSDRD
jgi:ABC-2 type transport system permease protein